MLSSLLGGIAGGVAAGVLMGTLTGTLVGAILRFNDAASDVAPELAPELAPAPEPQPASQPEPAQEPRSATFCPVCADEWQRAHDWVNVVPMGAPLLCAKHAPAQKRVRIDTDDPLVHAIAGMRLSPLIVIFPRKNEWSPSWN